MRRPALLIIPSVIALALVVAVNGGATHVPQRPPVIVLESKSPSQRAVWGSFCVSISPEPGESSGVGLCAEVPAGFPEPRWLSVVRPGERIKIVFRKTTKVRGGVAIYKRGCENQPPRATFKLTHARTRWMVPRAFRGRFELSIFARFETVDGRTGSTDAALGLFVSTKRDRGRIVNGERLACGELD